MSPKKKVKKSKTTPKKKEQISTLKGMHDILPKEQPWWDKVHQVVFDIAKFYGFGLVRTPVVEKLDLFERPLGESSDIVSKEMYSFKTRGGEEAALRPEGTASIARAYIQHGWASKPQPVKVFYEGPMFRYESPQKGRYRVHHQFGFEMMGIEDALADAEIVQIAFAILDDLGIKNTIAEVNTIGDKEDRAKYRAVLKDYFRPHIKKQCADCKERYKKNPLRILDCKSENCQEFLTAAPQAIDYIRDESKNHFKLFLEYLDEAGIPYLLNPHLVRGLDYYTRTVFEIFMERDEKDKDSKNSKNEKEGEEDEKPDKKSRLALISGGRYDGLVKMLKGKNVPAVGFGAGIERIVEAMKESKSRVGGRSKSKVFLVQLGELAKKKGLVLMEDLRKSNISIDEALGKHSIRSQLKIADKLGSRLAIILGQKEALADEIIIRDMETGVQETVPTSKLPKEIKKRLRS